MKILYFIILMFGFASARSQQWAPVGALWVYDVSQGSPLILTYIKSEKDTVVAGKECRLMAIRNISRMMNPNGTYYIDTSLVSKESIYNSNDTVYHYDRSLKVFYPLYLMNVQKSDTIIVRPGNPGCSNNSCVRFEYVVDSLTSCKLNDQELKVIYNAATNKSEWVFNRSGISENYPVIERIGSVKYFFGVSKIVIMEGTVLRLRCYTDNIITYKDAAFTGDCNSLFQPSLSGAKTSKLEIDKMIYPNPFKRLF
ncbi:MAG: hypothetical protein HC905_13320 [Bacteroidales bacterium]|nr:hypothetical protein [Bacteroidales bacterium]